jgi:integrase
MAKIRLLCCGICNLHMELPRVNSALGHGSVDVTERYYAKYDPKSAAKQLLRLIEGGKIRMGTKTGTLGE